ncbi:MAG TPA: menaquinone biosynthesis protein [Tepidisphaeraceae bacterium]|jgi:chorismate dehydratase|nr:menaquinone biosynthesis protein [Tepidisphaeraceae bacterium]
MATLSPTAARRPIRVASVSYFNSKPLIDGLDRDPFVELSLAVPAKLIDGLRDGSTDVALLPVIDYQSMGGLQIVPAGGIGCDGPTLTVRIFSRVPFEQIESLACDVESHTSVGLARVILAERYGLRPEIVPLDRARSPQTLLLIGDKVVCEEPVGYAHQLDLGEAWKQLTGKPFVFAVWTARAVVDVGDLPERLAQAKVRGLRRVDQLVDQFAVPRGWPVDIAKRYLTEYLKFDIGPQQIDAIRLFHTLAAKHCVVGTPVRPLQVRQS